MYISVYLLSVFLDQSTISGLEFFFNLVLLYSYATHPCRRVCVEWRVYNYMPSGNILFLGCLLGGDYVCCVHRMPGGVIEGDSGLCCCGPAFNVMCDVNCSSAITSHCMLLLCWKESSRTNADKCIIIIYTTGAYTTAIMTRQLSIINQKDDE